MNRFEMFDAMVSRTVVEMMTPNGMYVKGTIQGIELEDGSGHCFIVTLLPTNGKAVLNLFTMG